MELELTIAGDTQVRRKLLRVAHNAANARPAFEAIGELLLGWEREQFSSEGRRASGGWAPLKDSTIAARGTEHPILDETGALRTSLTERGGDNTLEATDDFLLFGSKLGYGGYHQTGTSRMAQRRPIELTERDRAGVVKVLQAFILGDAETGTATAALLGV